jgi:hypothetical protein
MFQLVTKRAQCKHGAEKVVILTQGNVEQPMLEIANDEDHNASSSAFSLDVNNVFIAATVLNIFLHLSNSPCTKH